MKYKERLFLKKLQIWQYYNHCLKNWIKLQICDFYGWLPQRKWVSS
jgi:hypothetical protein